MIVLNGAFLVLTLFLGLIGILLVIGLRKRINQAADRRPEQIAPHCRPVDIIELKAMLNIAEEGYLRLNLTPQQFRRAQNDRVLLAVEYFGRMSHNVALLYQWAAYSLMRSSRSFNRESRQASRELIDLCRAFRTVSWLARLKLQLWLLRMRLLDFASPPCLADVRTVRRVDLIYTYEQIKAAASTLSRTCGAGDQHEWSSVL